MSIQIGWGRREISLNEPLNIPGQAIMRISEGILDPLYVTALCVEGQDTVIFCSCDLTSLRDFGADSGKGRGYASGTAYRQRDHERHPYPYQLLPG